MPCAQGQEYWPCDSAAYQWNLCICDGDFTKLLQHGASRPTAHGKEIARAQHAMKAFPLERTFLSPIRAHALVQVMDQVQKIRGSAEAASQATFRKEL